MELRPRPPASRELWLVLNRSSSALERPWLALKKAESR